MRQADKKFAVSIFLCFDYMECCTLLMYWPQIFKVLVLKMLIMLLGTITLKTSFWIYNIYFVYRKSDSIILKCQMIHVSHYSSSLIFFRIEIQHVRSLSVFTTNFLRLSKTLLDIYEEHKNKFVIWTWILVFCKKMINRTNVLIYKFTLNPILYVCNLFF